MIKRTLYTFFMMVPFWKLLCCSTVHLADLPLPVTPQDPVSSTFTLVHMEDSESPADGRAPTAEPSDLTAIPVPPIDLSRIHTGYTSSSDALPTHQDSNAEEETESDGSSTKSVHFTQVESQQTTPGMGPQAPNTSPTEQKLSGASSTSTSDDSDHEKVQPISTPEIRPAPSGDETPSTEAKKDLSPLELDPNLINKNTDETCFTKFDTINTKNSERLNFLIDSPLRKKEKQKPIPLVYPPSDSINEFLSYEKNSESSEDCSSDDELEQSRDLLSDFLSELKSLRLADSPIVIGICVIFIAQVIHIASSYLFVR